MSSYHLPMFDKVLQ